MKKGKMWRRILSAFLSLALIVYLGYQIYSVNHDVIKTEYALDYTYYHTIPLQGFIVRDESLLSASVSDGVVGYCQPSGSKVAAGHIVAKVFESNEQAAVQTEIDAIDEIIESLEGIQTEGTQLSANAEILDSRINQTINRLLSITDTGVTTGFDAVSNELIQLLNKKQIALGTAGDFKTYITNLKAQRTALEGSIGTCTNITADSSGYFVNGTDGCETVLDYENMAELTLSDLNRAFSAQPKETDEVGKIVSSSEWYLAATVDQSISQHLAIGDSVDMTIPLIFDDVYDCEVIALNVDYTAETTVIVLKCGQMNERIADARIEKAELRINTYHGLRVNQSALRVVDGITGVYVADGISVAFKPVDILYSDTGFAICAYDSTNSNNLKQYDEIIVGGGDLYDGKIIR